MKAFMPTQWGNAGVWGLVLEKDRRGNGRTAQDVKCVDDIHMFRHLIRRSVAVEIPVNLLEGIRVCDQMFDAQTHGLLDHGLDGRNGEHRARNDDATDEPSERSVLQYNFHLIENL